MRFYYTLENTNSGQCCIGHDAIQDLADKLGVDWDGRSQTLATKTRQEVEPLAGYVVTITDQVLQEGEYLASVAGIYPNCSIEELRQMGMLDPSQVFAR